LHIDMKLKNFGRRISDFGGSLNLDLGGLIDFQVQTSSEIRHPKSQNVSS
jgi:hypothetical protein